MSRRGSYWWAVEHFGKPCHPSTFHRVEIAPGFVIPVARGSVPVWRALAGVLYAYRYPIRRRDTGSYSCRPTTGGSTPSRHSWALAVDVNWRTNPYIRTPSLRPIRWGVDTDMPAAMIRDVEAITVNGVQALEWGGRWRRVKDAMHFQLRVTAEEIAEFGVRSPKPITIGEGDEAMTLRNGDNGPAVEKLQYALIAWKPGEALPNFGADSDFGDETQEWVERYQRAAEIPRVTFGVADPTTIAFLLSNLTSEPITDGRFAVVGHRHRMNVTAETGGSE